MRASNGSKVRRIVMTSSFGAVLDMARPPEQPWAYSQDDWNPVTYQDALAQTATPQDAYRASKVLAEREAWRFMNEEAPSFDLVTLCPSMVFGPLVSPPTSVAELSESNKMLWKVMSGSTTDSLPPCRFNFWMDVRNLAEVHILALMNPAAGGERYVPVSKEGFSYEMASNALQEAFQALKGNIPSGSQPVQPHITVDHAPVDRDLPISYIPFKETVLDLAHQIKGFI